MKKFLLNLFFLFFSAMLFTNALAQYLYCSIWYEKFERWVKSNSSKRNELYLLEEQFQFLSVLSAMVFLAILYSFIKQFKHLRPKLKLFYRKHTNFIADFGIIYLPIGLLLMAFIYALPVFESRAGYFIFKESLILSVWLSIGFSLLHSLLLYVGQKHWMLFFITVVLFIFYGFISLLALAFSGSRGVWF